jgi:hypothetical protein
VDRWAEPVQFSRSRLFDISFNDADPGCVDPGSAKAMLTNIPGQQEVCDDSTPPRGASWEPLVLLSRQYLESQD